MRTILINYIMALLVSVSTCVFATSNKPGDIAADFTLQALDKKHISLDSLLAKGYVMLVFWETQCVYCYSHIADFNRLQKQYKDRLTIAGINFLGEYPEEIQEYADNNQVKYLLLADRLNNIDVAEAYAVIGSPTIVVIAPDKKIVYYGYQLPDLSKLIK